MSQLDALQLVISRLNKACRLRGLRFRTWETEIGTWIARATKRATASAPGGDYVQICRRTRLEAVEDLVGLVRERFPTSGRPGARHGNRNASRTNRDAARRRLELEQRGAMGAAA